ncbi:hypothetical protein PO909_004015 [Leuciscus waleckii]
MSWSDLFFPGNPERRERLIRKGQELRELMKNNFRATNQLIEALKKHLGLSFRPVTLNEKATVKENCDVIIERIHEIQAEVEKIDQQMKKKLEPTLYEKLRNMSLTVHDYSLFSDVVHAVCGVAAFSSIVLVGLLVNSGSILTSMTLTFGLIGTGAMASLVVGVLFLGIDMIFGAIQGSIERDQLENALLEYDKALKEFRPASEKYQDCITYVRVRVEDLEGTRMLSVFFGKKDKSKKEEMIRSTQTLHHYVHKYFNITNRLLEVLNTHFILESPLPAVEANESQSIEENCARVSDAMRLILDVSEKENKHVQKEGHDLYNQIAFSGVSLKDKAALIKDLHQKTMGLLGNIFGPVVAVRLANSDLGSVMPPVEQKTIQPVLSFALGDLVQSSARIIELLCEPGNQQKSLDEAVELVEDAVSVLKPPCDSYNDILSEVEAYITIISENM